MVPFDRIFGKINYSYGALFWILSAEISIRICSRPHTFSRMRCFKKEDPIT